MIRAPNLEKLKKGPPASHLLKWHWKSFIYLIYLISQVYSTGPSLCSRLACSKYVITIGPYQVPATYNIYTLGTYTPSVPTVIFLSVLLFICFNYCVIAFITWWIRLHYYHQMFHSMDRTPTIHKYILAHGYHLSTFIIFINLINTTDACSVINLFPATSSPIIITSLWDAAETVIIQHAFLLRVQSRSKISTRIVTIIFPNFEQNLRHHRTEFWGSFHHVMISIHTKLDRLFIFFNNVHRLNSEIRIWEIERGNFGEFLLPHPAPQLLRWSQSMNNLTGTEHYYYGIFHNFHHLSFEP